MIFKQTAKGFILLENHEVKASATLLWIRPETKCKKKPYLTDVASFQKGCGTILMNNIINFFEQKKRDRSGYDSSKILSWFQVYKLG
jgi:hypothetical protein